MNGPLSVLGKSDPCGYRWYCGLAGAQIVHKPNRFHILVFRIHYSSPHHQPNCITRSADARPRDADEDEFDVESSVMEEIITLPSSSVVV
ncbi:hypothetical protein BT69DRAFT_1284189 [Atractiella rhizophila]|nr:hypothetical protein BT69DRAFT_1288277 [Atractiella rhizophila]KAH8920252.1 hypothetical protein BT69DRAFT_1284189 [Atractiella rhizophila]